MNLADSFIKFISVIITRAAWAFYRAHRLIILGDPAAAVLYGCCTLKRVDPYGIK
jgi:hypothetical protein